MRDDLEERRRRLAGQRQIAQLVNYEKSRAGEEPHHLRPAALDGGTVATRRQVRRGGVVDAVPGLHGPVSQAQRQHGLAHAGRTDEKDVGGLLDETQRAQVLDQLAVDAGLGIEVEVLQPPWRRETRETKSCVLAPLFRGGHLSSEQPLEEGGVGELFIGSPLQLLGQRLGRVLQTQGGEVTAQLLVAARRRRHKATSASSA